MSLFKILQTVASASGATEAAQNLLEKAVSKDAQDQILTFSTRAAYLEQKVLQAEKAIIGLQTRVTELSIKNENLKKRKDENLEALLDMTKKYEGAQKESNDLKVAYEDLKIAKDKAEKKALVLQIAQGNSKNAQGHAEKEAYERGLEEGREAANEDRDAAEGAK